MRTFDSTTAESYLVADIEVVRWEQYGLGDAMPFNAMWYSVPPGSTSPADSHPELELSIVLNGRVTVSVDDSVADIEAGNAFLVEGGETHVVRNATDEPVVVFSAYWMPAAAGSAADATRAADATGAAAHA